MAFNAIIMSEKLSQGTFSVYYWFLYVLFLPQLLVHSLSSLGTPPLCSPASQHLSPKGIIETPFFDDLILFFTSTWHAMPRNNHVGLP